VTDEIIAEDAVEILEPLDEDALMADLFAQMQGVQALPTMPDVDRYWLSDYGYINLSLVHQDANVALLVNDGEHTIALFDSSQADLDFLYQIASIVQTAISIADPLTELLVDGEEGTTNGEGE
jgi:hypothetical protein